MGNIFGLIVVIFFMCVFSGVFYLIACYSVHMDG